MRGIHSVGTVRPSHWASQPADSAPMRRFTSSQTANSTYMPLRLTNAVVSTNSASTMRPPSSSPALRWNSKPELTRAAVGHCSTVMRAGPTKWLSHSRAAGLPAASSRTAKPALAADRWPSLDMRLALPNGCSVAAFQQRRSVAWREANSMLSVAASTR